MSEQYVGSSAEAVERVVAAVEIARGNLNAQGEFGRDLLQASALLRVLQKRCEQGDALLTAEVSRYQHNADCDQRRIAELEALLAERNQQNAAAFTASDAYQRRLESADKIIADALPFVAQWEAADAADLESQSLMVKRIDAHLAGEAMGAREGK